MAAVAAVGCEAARIERVGLLPQPLMAVNDPRPDRDEIARFDLLVPEPIVGDRFAVEPRDRRVEAQRFLDDRAQQRQPVGKRRVDAATERVPRLARHFLLQLGLLGEQI